jgi:hypothetical protein
MEMLVCCKAGSHSIAKWFTTAAMFACLLAIAPKVFGQPAVLAPAAEKQTPAAVEANKPVVDAPSIDANKVSTGAAADAAKVAASDIEKIIAAGRTNNQVMAHLDYLTNRIGPRLSSSEGLATACEWARETFESFGLENAKLDQWAEWPVGFNRGPSAGRMIAPEVWALDFATDAWTAGTKGRQRGPAILAPTNEEDLEAIRDKLAGVWVMSPTAPGRRGGGRRGQRGGQPPEEARNGQPENRQPGDGQPAGERPNAAQPDQAQPADAGAAPVRTGGNAGESQPNQAQPADGQPRQDQPREGQPGEAQVAAQQPGDAAQPGERGRGEGGGRGRGQRGGGNDPFQQRLRDVYREAGILGTINRRDGELLVTGGRRPTSLDFFDNLPTMPQITMTASSFDAVAKHIREGREVALEFDIRNYFKKGPIPLHNVLADIPGSEWPDEYVIVCGHLDSWDAATGTTDNGTGCATTIEAARILMASGVRPRRTIRFMLWTGEEQGLLGSRAYVQANPELMKKISAVLNHDVGTQYISSISALPYQMADLEAVFAPVVSLNPQFPFRINPSEGQRGGGGSDHASFIRAGVPGYIWGQSGDLARYRDTHHTQLDTYDRAVPAYQEHSSLVVALAAYGIANLDHMLARQNEE